MDDTLHEIARVGIGAGVFLGMLAIGTKAPLGQIIASLRNPRMVATALLANFVAVPVLALALSRLLPMADEGRTALILLGATAGAPFLPKLAELSHGHLPFAVGLMVILMAATVVYAPLVLPLMLPHVTVAPAEIARSLVVVMLLPLTLGLLSRERYPRIAEWSDDLGRVGGAGLALGLGAGLLMDGSRLLAAYGSGMLIGAALLTLGAMGIGWVVSLDAERGERRVAALGTGLRNFAAALLVAQEFGPDTLVMTMAGTMTLSIVLVIAAGEMGLRMERVRPAGS